MNIKDIKEQNTLLLECISGSRAYGLDTPQSDTDIKGVFLLPKKQFYTLDYTAQVNNDSNDEMFYELGKFLELLSKNNPNILELLNTPADCEIYSHPVMKLFPSDLFLSTLCKKTFGNYAMIQVKKARGLNKKILNPVEKERKKVLDFCFVAGGAGSVPLKKFLEDEGIQQELCGLSKMPHMHDLYALYFHSKGVYKGIVQSEDANDISLSSIPKGEKPLAFMSFNLSGYSAYCKDYKAYWDWVNERNETRYESTMSHGKRYDAKNMMHTFRLIAMAEEIGKYGVLNVRREDREFLLKVKAGEFEYDDLLKQAEDRISGLEIIYQNTNLPEQPDYQKINELHFEARERLYVGKE